MTLRAVEESQREVWIQATVNKQTDYQFNFNIIEGEEERIVVVYKTQHLQLNTEFTLNRALRVIHLIDEAIINQVEIGDEFYIACSSHIHRLTDYVSGGQYVRSISGDAQEDSIIMMLQELNRDIKKCPHGYPDEDRVGAQFPRKEERKGKQLKWDENGVNIIAWDGQGEFDDRYLLKASNLSDLTSVGTARDNLGLGTAATRDVGTGAGNVLPSNYSGLLTPAQKATLTNGSVADGLHTHSGFIRTSEKGADNGVCELVGGLILERRIPRRFIEGFIKAIGNVTPGHISVFNDTDGNIRDTGYTIPTSGIVGLSEAMTLRNKTISADNNTLQNIDYTNFRANFMLNNITNVEEPRKHIASVEAIKNFAVPMAWRGRPTVGWCYLDASGKVPRELLHEVHFDGVKFIGDESSAIVGQFPMFADREGNIKNSNKSVPTGALVGTTDIQNLLHKTLRKSDGNTLLGYDLDIFAAGVVVTEIDEDPDDDTIPTTKAVADYASSEGFVRYKGQHALGNNVKVAAFYDTYGNIQDVGKVLPQGDLVGTNDLQDISYKTISAELNTIKDLTILNFKTKSICQVIPTDEEASPQQLTSAKAVKDYADTKIPLSQKDAANGVPSLDGSKYINPARIRNLTVDHFVYGLIVTEFEEDTEYTDDQLATAKAISDKFTSLIPSINIDYQNMGSIGVFKEKVVSAYGTNVKFRGVSGVSPITATLNETGNVINISATTNQANALLKLGNDSLISVNFMPETIANIGTGIGCFAQYENHIAKFKTFKATSPLLVSNAEQNTVINISALTNQENALVQLDEDGLIPEELMPPSYASSIENVGDGMGVFKGVDETTKTSQLRSLVGENPISLALNDEETEVHISINLESVGTGATACDIYKGISQAGKAQFRKIKGDGTKVIVEAIVDDDVINVRLNPTWTSTLASASDLSTLKSRVDILEPKVTTLEGQVSTLSGNLTTLSGTVAGLQAELTTLSGTVSTLSTTVLGMEAEILTIQTTLATKAATSYVDDAIDNLQNLLEIEIDSSKTAAVDEAKQYTDAALGTLIESDGGLLSRADGELITISIGQSGQVLTVENGMPTWKNGGGSTQTRAYFRATISTSYEITSTVHGDIFFDVVDYNEGGTYDTSTFSWKVPVTGVYRFSCVISYSTTSAAAWLCVFFYNNNSKTAYKVHEGQATYTDAALTSAECISASCCMKCNANETINCCGYARPPKNEKIVINGGSRISSYNSKAISVFSGELLYEISQ